MQGEQQAATGKLTLSILIDCCTPGAIWLSALAPAVLGVFFAMETGVSLQVPLVAVVLLIPVLFNASINLINDYYDYIQGNDTNENIFGETDAPLAYNKIENPKPVLWAGFLCLLVGGLLGLYVISQAGFKPLIIGAIGAISVLTYSGWKNSVSYLPIGELVAGFVMGGLIPLGVYTSLTGQIDWSLLYKSIPMMLIVSQFMLVNNTCDMERDSAVGRRTLSIVIGRQHIHKVAAIFTFVWIITMLHISIVWYTIGSPIIILMIFLFRRKFAKIYTGQRTKETKIEDVWNMVQVATMVGILYPISILIHILVMKLLMS